MTKCWETKCQMTNYWATKCQMTKFWAKKCWTNKCWTKTFWAKKCSTNKCQSKNVKWQNVEQKNVEWQNVEWHSDSFNPIHVSDWSESSCFTTHFQDFLKRLLHHSLQFRDFFWGRSSSKSQTLRCKGPSAQRWPGGNSFENTFEPNVFLAFTYLTDCTNFACICT
jgi:hypothetical protein